MVRSLVALLLFVAGCSEPAVHAEPPVRVRVAAVHEEAPAPPPRPTPPPAVVERVTVPGDREASIVRGARSEPPRTVFLPGICSNANAYLWAFPEAARAQGGVVAIDGDQPCGDLAGFHSFSWDAARLDARIRAAFAAAAAVEIPPEGLTLVGYSQGAALGEQLVDRWPERYSRVVLIGAPTDPSPRHFARARAVVTMSCSRDVPARMRLAAEGISRAGIPATYIEMPGCTHGNVADGDAALGSAFEWLRRHAVVEGG